MRRRSRANVRVQHTTLVVVVVMARGLSREISKAKGDKKAAAKAKGNKGDLTPAQRAERDAKAMREKAEAKAKAKADLLASGGADAAAQLAEEEKKKAAMRAKQRESKFASANPLLAKKLTGK